MTDTEKNQEIVELTEKDLKKVVERIKRSEYSENIEDDYSERKVALSILGFGKNRLNKENFPNQNVDLPELPELTEEDYVRMTTKDLVEEMLEGNHIELDLLQDIVKIQNGISDNTLELSDTMKKIIVDDEALEKETVLERDLNMKKLKANIEAGRINPEQEWIELLKEKTDYENIKLTDEELLRFTQQIPSEDQPEAEIQEKSDLKIDSKIPKIERNVEEYWNNLYRIELEKMGLLEMRLHRDGGELKRAKFDNEFLDKGAKIYTKLKNMANNPFEATSIVQIDEEYNIPMQELFRESRSSNGIKFKTLPGEDEQHTFKLAALKVRSSGIVSPYVYAAKPTSDHDLLAKNKFIENQIRALIEYADYDIEDISVPHRFKPVLEKMKNEEAKKNMHVMDMDNILEKVINGETTEMERRAFLEYIDIKDEHNGFEVSVNFNQEDSNDKKLIDTILKGKPLLEENSLPLGRSGQVSLLIEKFEFAKNYTTGQEPLTAEQVEPDNQEGLTNSNQQELTNERNSDLDLESNTLTAGESEIIRNKKILEKFDNYEGDKSNPESNINEQLEAIVGLKNKLNNPEIAKQLSTSQAELIERKAVIAETFQNNPQLDDNQKSIIKKLLHQGVVDMNHRNLHPVEENELDTLMKNDNFTSFRNTVNKLRGISEPSPKEEVTFDNVSQQENVENEQPENKSVPVDNNSQITQAEMERMNSQITQAEMERMNSEVPPPEEEFHPDFTPQTDMGIPETDFGENPMQDYMDAEQATNQESNFEMPEGINNSQIEQKKEENQAIEEPITEEADKILKAKQKQKVKVIKNKM